MAKRIAVIGGGISGIYSAFQLQKDFDVTIFEASSRLGGHALSMDVGDGVFADVAFLIYNSHSYPQFIRFLEDLELQDIFLPVEMSFGLERKGINFAINNKKKGSLNFKRNWGKPKFLRILLDLFRYRKLELTRTEGLSIVQYLSQLNFSNAFIEHFALPMGASVWSNPPEQVAQMPAQTFVQFFNHHRVLKRKHGAEWLTINGSSKRTIDKFVQSFNGKVRLNAPVTKVATRDSTVIVTTAGGALEYDAVVIGVHADDALKMLENPTTLETDLLGKWSYSQVPATLHTDAALMPASPQTWSSWNITERDGQTNVTYDLQSIQKLPRPLFLTLGPCQVDEGKILHTFNFKHMVLSPESAATQALLPSLNKQGRIFFAGSYFGSGFHEDAIVAAQGAVTNLRERI